MIPIVEFDNQVADNGIWHPDRLKFASEKFKSAGCLWLKGLFPPDYIKFLHKKFIQITRNEIDPASTIFAGSLEVGDRRLMIPVPVRSSFNDPFLYANPILYSFLKEALGSQFILNGLGAVISFPDATDQHIHKDHPALFGTPIDDFLPPFAVTVIVPLISLNELTGTTRMWAGSHLLKYLLSDPEKEFTERQYYDPYTSLGDCLLMDYRLFHGGRANRSDSIRPILYLNYSRAWFRDSVNYRNHLPLKITPAEYKKIPPTYRHLMAHLFIDG